MRYGFVLGLVKGEKGLLTRDSIEDQFPAYSVLYFELGSYGYLRLEAYDYVKHRHSVLETVARSVGAV